MVSKVRNFRSNNAFLVSLALHIIAAIFFAGYPMSQYFQQRGSAIAVEWVKDVPEPKLEREMPKQPIEMKFDPTRELDLKAKKKISRASASKIAWVKQRSNRLVDRSVEVNDAERSDIIPDLMTAARVRDSYSSISGLVSTDEGPIDGRGILGNRVRAKGSGEGGRSGVSLLGIGGTGDGLAGGGGGGLLDRLGIINFIDESQGPQKVVYCLDVSASMAMGYKLPVSVKSLKESLLQLGDFDEFNIVTFHSGVHRFREELVPATMENMERASRFLDSFTPRNIENNLGTDILAALRYALNMKPSVIVLITDIQPTRGEVDEERIAEEVRKINKNDTKIYGIGVEVWEPRPNGRLAKLLRMLTEQNHGEMRLARSG